MPESRKVTIQTVAENAGVSKSTVSRVISNSPDISEKTKKKVFDVMEQLNYHPSAIARSLANRISKNIGLVLPADEDFFLNPFFQESLRAIAKTASHRGYDTLIVYNGKNEKDSIKRLINANKVDGVILMRSVVGDETVSYLREMKFPFVLIGKSVEYDDIYSVDTDNIEASEKLTERLVEKGCRKIGFIGGDSNSVVTIDRYKGYERALKNKGVKFLQSMVEEKEFNEKNGFTSLRNMMREHEDLDGLIVTDSLIFTGAVEYLLSTENSLKRKLIIGSFGTNRSFYRENMEIIDVDVDSKKLGEKSCNKLIDLLENRKTEMFDLVEYTIREKV